MPFTILRQDITRMKVDAVVNAANTGLKMGGGVSEAIFKAAGAEKMQKACDELSPIKTGDAVITPGFDLFAKYVIHAVGPIYSHYKAEQNRILLRSAYIKSLEIALKNKCSSIAFPLIAAGIYGYPKREALQVATDVIRVFLADHDMDIYLVIFDRASFEVSEELLGAVESYIDEKYVANRCRKSRKLIDAEDRVLCKLSKTFSTEAAPMAAHKNLDSLIMELDEPFNTTLLRLIDAKGKTDAEVYKRANIDRKLFSKIRTGKCYTPGKRTILALAIALELSLDETDDLLERAGYALSHSQKFDVIVEFFIVNKKYDIFAINEVLFKYDQPLLGSG